VAADDELTAQRFKDEFFPVRFIETGQDIRRAQRGMAAQIDFAPRRKPAQAVVVPFFYGKRRFGQVIFNGNALHDVIWQPFLHDTHGSRVALEHFLCKGIDNVAFHDVYLLWTSCFPFSSS